MCVCACIQGIPLDGRGAQEPRVATSVPNAVSSHHDGPQTHHVPSMGFFRVSCLSGVHLYWFFVCFLAFVCVLITFMPLDAFASCCIVQQWGTGRRVCGSRRINYAASCSAHSRQSESRRLEAASPNTTVNQLQQQAAKATEKGSKIKAKANQAWQS